MRDTAVFRRRVPRRRRAFKRRRNVLLGLPASQDDGIGRRKDEKRGACLAAVKDYAPRHVDEHWRRELLSRNKPHGLRCKSVVYDDKAGVAAGKPRSMDLDAVYVCARHEIARLASGVNPAIRRNRGKKPPLVAALREPDADVVDRALANLPPRNSGMPVWKRCKRLPSCAFMELHLSIWNGLVFKSLEKELRRLAGDGTFESDPGEAVFRLFALAAPLVETKGLLHEDERAARPDPRLEPGGRLVVHRIDSSRNEDAIAVKTSRLKLFLEHGVERNVRVDGKRIRARLGKGRASARRSLRQAVRRHREKCCHALLLLKAAQTRSEEILHREDVALRVHYPDKLLWRHENRVEPEPRIPFAEAFQALGWIFHVDFPQTTLPLEVVACVEPARPLRQQPRAVARARAPEIRLAVDHGLAVRERAQGDVGIEAAAAGRHHRHLAQVIRGGGLDDVADARHRLEAETRRGVDRAYRRDAKLDTGYEALLAELVPRGKEARGLFRRLEGRGRLERAVRSPPRPVHRGCIAVPCLREKRGKCAARGGRRVVVARLVEELIDIRLRAVRL